MRIAARRSAWSSLFSCIPAAVISSSALISGSVSFSCALRTSGSIAASAPPARAFAAARRSLLEFGESKLQNAKALRRSAPRTRLFITTSTFLPSMRDLAFRRLAQDVGGLGIALGDQRGDRGDLVVVIVRGELFHLGAVERPSTEIAYEKGRHEGGPFLP